MKRHPIDVVSLVLGVITVVAAVAAVNNRLGNLINDRPGVLVPMLVLLAGLSVLTVTARRVLHGESLQDVDGAGDDEHDRAE